MSKMIIDAYGNKIWYNDKGQYHREDGPAIEQIGSTMGVWWRNSDQIQWWYNGKRINCNTQEEFEYLMRLELFW